MLSLKRGRLKRPGGEGGERRLGERREEGEKIMDVRMKNREDLLRGWRGGGRIEKRMWRRGRGKREEEMLLSFVTTQYR